MVKDKDLLGTIKDVTETDESIPTTHLTRRISYEANWYVTETDESTRGGGGTHHFLVGMCRTGFQKEGLGSGFSLKN